MANIPSKISKEVAAKYSIDRQNKFFGITPKDDWRDRVQVEIGDSKTANDVLPQVKIMRWDNEVNCSLRLKDFTGYSVKTEADKIKLVGDKQEVHLYDLAPQEGLEESGYEFEVILKERPLTNKVEFSLETKNLRFSYQPSLIDEIKLGGEDNIAKVTETDAIDIDGNVVIHRPEKVVGAYVVYALEEKINYVGDKEYKTGQVGMIYRPRIIDSAGTEVWGKLNIDLKTGILKVEIPQEFLDKAVYPIKQAAGLNFGYETGGGTSYSGSAGTFYRAYTTFTPTSNGTLDSISVYVATSAIGANWKGAIYNNTTRVDYTNSQSISGSFGPNWKTESFVGGNSVFNGTYYNITAKKDNIQSNWYYNTDSDHSYYSASTYADTPPATITWTQSGTYSNKYSFYATYAAAGSASPSISPSKSPSKSPSASPSQSPSASLSPSKSPSKSPSISPSKSPSKSPSISPSKSPSISPSASPSASPSQSPSASLSPSKSPSVSPSISPSKSPSISPSKSPSISPSKSPSASPSISPSQSPSASLSPSKSPSASPSKSPSVSPSLSPSISPSISPSKSPSISPSVSPSPSLGWEEYTRGDEVNLPADDTNLETNYSAQDYLDVNTKNDVRVEQTASDEFAIHQFKDYAGSQTKASLECELQSSLAPSSSAVYLQIYNQEINEWETVDLDDSTAADTDFSLTAEVNDLTDYKDTNNIISCRVYQEAV